MLKKYLIVLCVCFASFSVPLSAQEVSSCVKIYAPEDAVKRSEILSLLEIDHFYTEDGAIISEISSRKLALLQSMKYKYKILVADVAKNLEQQNKIYYKKSKELADQPQSRVAFEQPGGLIGGIIPKPSAFVVQPTFGGYYSIDQMYAAIDDLVATYPTIASKIFLGNSIEGRPIFAVKISDNVELDETDEPEILYTALQHAREAIGGSSMIFFMQYLCEQYTADPRVKDLVDNRELFLIPCANPDGYERNRRTNPNGGGGQRKNRNKNTGSDSTGAGVDLNRNYGIDWGNCAGASSGCGSNTPSGETYYGTEAFSEPESQAIRDLVLSHHFVAAMDQHCYGPYYSLPYGRPMLHSAFSTADKNFYTAIPALMGTYNGMRAGNSPESVGYEVAGGIKDWLLLGDIGTGTKGKVYGMTGEGGTGGGTTGSYASFWAPASQIVNLCKGICYQNLQLAYAAGSYVNIQDMTDIAVTSRTGSFSFKITRLGLDTAAVNISLLPIENITSGSATITSPTLVNYYDSYTGRVNYSLPTGITNGQRIRFVWKVETGGYSYSDTVVKFYNPTQLLFDNMEGSFSTNWTSTSNVTGTAGNWAFTSLAAFGGSKSMTESPSGNYSASTTRICTYKNTFNLSGTTAAYLTFWTKYRAENFRDKLQIKVSTNGSTWVALNATSTVKEPGTLDGSTLNGQPSLTGIRDLWTKQVVDLSRYKGNTSLRLRFEFTSDANTTGYKYQVDDGFYIDDVKVIKTSASISSTEATELAQRNGAITSPEEVSASIYPNPVQEAVYVKLQGGEQKNFRIRVIDAMGRTVYQYSSLPSGRLLTIDTKTWTPQFYVVEIMNDKNEVLRKEKIVKQ